MVKAKKTVTQSIKLKALIICALLLSIALVIKQFSVMIPIMGVGGLRVGFSGIFSSLPSIMFGPWYGGLVSGLSDIIGFLLKPEGAWIPALTITAFLSGILRGFAWKTACKCSTKNIYITVTVFFSLLLIFGISSLVSLSIFPESALGTFISSLSSKGVSQSFFATYLPLFSGIIGFILLGISFIIHKKLSKSGGENIFPQLILVFVATGIFITTVNTFILMDAYSIKKAFILFYTPRLIEEIVSSLINAYAISVILPKFKKLY